ncbi:MAG TPA: carboxypeptidase regulatory-like domain-containing protein [Bryobacteraceae bacterium]|jgi:hypothetical protein
MKTSFGIFSIRILAIFAFLMVCDTPALRAQSSTGEIDVVVKDSTDAVVADARVTIRGAETGAVVRTLETNTTGLAAAPLVNPGVYDITVEKEGFKTVVRKGLVLRVTETVSLQINLELGQTTQSVTVGAAAELVDTTSNAVGQVVGGETAEQLPLNGRNYLQLALLTAGTVPSANKDQSFSAFGNRGMQNQYMLDGGINESFIRGIDNHQRDAMRPSLEAVQEFKVQTGNFSAEYGSSAGGVVTVVTKSGTNEIHGSAFEFLRNSAISARDFFAPPGKVPPLAFNQFGGSGGGPIKKNRAWIFGAYQQTEIRQASTLISAVPTVAMKNGIFPNTIYDPSTTAPNPNGSGFVRTPFPNNTIPAASFNSIGLMLAKLYPDPNLSTSGNNYVLNAPGSTSLGNGTFRGDVQLSSKDNAFARFSFNRGTISGYPALPQPADTPVLEHLPAWNVGVGETHVFGPALVNEFRFAWSRPTVAKDGTLPRNSIIPNALSAGIDSSIPMFNVTGFAGLGAQPIGLTNVPLSKTSGVWEFSDNASKNVGNHLLKFGYTHQYVRMYTFTALSGRGTLSFDGSYTQNPQSRTGTGSGLADLLLGLAQGVTTSSTGVSNLRANNDLMYFQDDWKVTRRLTLNLGLRYELYWPLTEVNNELGNFVSDPSDPNFGKMIFAGTGGNSRSLMNVDKRAIAPRFGFAYQVPHSGDLTIRGGFGLFYGNPDEQTGVGNMMTNNPPFVGYGSVSLAGDKNNPATAFNLNGSLPAVQSVTNPSSFVLVPTATSGLISWPKYYKDPVVNQWNLSIQKQLPGSTIMELNYVGNNANGLWNSYPGNQPLLPGPGAVIPRRALAAFTQAPITAMGAWGFSHYEGVTARVEKKMTHGIYMLASFTYGRAIDLSSGVSLDGCSYCGVSESVENAYNLSAQKGPSDSNVPRRLVFSTTWDPPFGKSRHYLKTGVPAAILGDWEMSAIWTAQDGQPFTLNLSVDNANVGNTNWPNRVCSGRLDHPTLQQWFDPSCFVVPPLYTYGNAGRNVLYGPGTDNVDFAVHRFFPIPIRENMRLEFRAEFFNFLNHPEFAMPNVTLNLATTGQITATSIPNREVQFALKLAF